MHNIQFKSALLGFSFAVALMAAYAFGSTSNSLKYHALAETGVASSESGWTDLGGAVYVPDVGVYQVIYGDFGFKVVEVVGFD